MLDMQKTIQLRDLKKKEIRCQVLWVNMKLNSVSSVGLFELFYPMIHLVNVYITNWTITMLLMGKFTTFLW